MSMVGYHLITLEKLENRNLGFNGVGTFLPPLANSCDDC